MKSVMIVYNQANTERVEYMLDKLNVTGFTFFEQVQGRGTNGGEPRRGTHAWPEMNSCMITVVEDNQVEDLLEGIQPDGSISDSAKEAVMALLKRSFRPEFLNRLDEIVFYKPLTKDNITKIIDLQIDKLNQRLAQQQISCQVTEAAKNAIMDAAYNPEFGARPLRRYVQHTVETMLSKRLLRGDILPNQTVTVDVVDGQLEIR